MPERDPSGTRSNTVFGGFLGCFSRISLPASEPAGGPDQLCIGFLSVGLQVDPVGEEPAAVSLGIIGPVDQMDIGIGVSQGFDGGVGLGRPGYAGGVDSHPVDLTVGSQLVDDLLPDRLTEGPIGAQVENDDIAQEIFLLQGVNKVLDRPGLA